MGIWIGGCASAPSPVGIELKETDLKEICSQYNLDWQWDSVTQVVTLEKNGQKARALVGSDVVMLGEERVNLSSALKRYKSRIIVPADFKRKVVDRLNERPAYVIKKFKEIIIDGTSTALQNNLIDPFSIVFSSDGARYYISCQASSDIRVFQASNDSLLAVIPVSNYPKEISFSAGANYLFVSCTEDASSFKGVIGSVGVIDCSNNTLIKKIHTGFEPYGLAVDDANKIVYVTNMNANNGGPMPHHQSNCGGRNGYVTIIDLNTLELLPGKKMELANAPNAIAIRK